MSRERISSSSTEKPPPSASSLPKRLHTCRAPRGGAAQHHAGARSPCGRRGRPYRVAPERLRDEVAVALVDVDQHHLSTRQSPPDAAGAISRRAHASAARSASVTRRAKASTSQLPSWRMAAARSSWVVLFPLYRAGGAGPISVTQTQGLTAGADHSLATRARKAAPLNIDPPQRRRRRGAGRHHSAPRVCGNRRGRLAAAAPAAVGGVGRAHRPADAGTLEPR